MNSALPEWLTIQQTARYLNVSVPFIRNRVRLRSIPFVRIGNKVLRFRKDALDRWLGSNGCGEEITHRKHEGR